MADLVVVATLVKSVEVRDQSSGPEGATLAVGDLVIPDGTTGKYVKADASAASTLKGAAIVIARFGNTVTVMRKGLLNMGEALAALAFGAEVYASDTAGVLADGVGTATLLVGRVVPGWGATSPDRVLRVEL